jgi:hypothetical protein
VRALLQLIWRNGDKAGETIVDECSPFSWNKKLFDASQGRQDERSRKLLWRPAELDRIDFDSRCVGRRGSVASVSQ